jgi:7-carboxy-7-deazaguanine synthase (Cx14CxxC type)
MTYSVKEIYYTLQGEGAQSGRSAVFLRFAGCNLWSGRERDRERAVCRFCDTDFVGTDGPGGGKFESAEGLASAVSEHWHGAAGFGTPYVVCTGGEPLLQLDAPAIEAMQAVGFEVAVETNGTQPLPKGLDWVCVSPKADAPVVVAGGDELKLVYPQEKAQPMHWHAFLPLQNSSRSKPIPSSYKPHSAGLGVLSLRRVPNLGTSCVSRSLVPTSPLEPTSCLFPIPLFSHPVASAVRPPRHWAHRPLHSGSLHAGRIQAPPLSWMVPA